jgi:hypothetical protein
MIGIPWVTLKESLAELGHLPLLGWPNDIDPYTCVFTWQKGGAVAVKAQVIIAEWSPLDKEWMDLR